MRLQALACGLALLASACTTTAYDVTGQGGGGGSPGGSADNPGAGGGGSGGSGGGSNPGPGGMGMTVSGAIASNTTWSGLVNATGDVTVNQGAILTIDAGALVKFAANKALIVNGTLKVTGSAASLVTLQPDTLPGNWGGIQVAAGGSVNVSYATLTYAQTALSCATGAAGCAADHMTVTNFSGLAMTIQSSATFDHIKVENGGSGGIYAIAGANDTVKITNSIFHATGGDAVTSDSGNFTFQFNHSYGNGGSTPQVHCACHFDTTGLLLVDHNDFDDTSVGFMASNMADGSKINYNNFSANAQVWSPASGNINAKADLSKNYWGSATPPTIGGNTTNQKVNGMPVDAFYTATVPGTGPQP
jgi:hypothetical protein